MVDVQRSNGRDMRLSKKEPPIPHSTVCVKVNLIRKRILIERIRPEIAELACPVRYIVTVSVGYHLDA
jgi:hypothetical protein